jgi:hypothetical protein
MRRTPDIREFQKEHLLEISDVMNYIKNGFRVEPCIPKEQVVHAPVELLEEVNEVKNVVVNMEVEEEKW